MGQQQSREESLYNEAVKGNLQAIKSLRSNGAGLEWLDEEGKTPLIVACSSSKLFIVAKTLIELGANVSSFRAGGDGGTPLHHAAKRGLRQTVKFLLSHGGISYSIRICNVYNWVVIIPCSLHDPTKLELLIYHSLLDFSPRIIIDLWNADIKEPNLHQSDPVLIIFDKSSKTRYRFASANDGDKQQLYCLYNSCRGIPQTQPPLSSNNANDWVDAADESTHNGWDPFGGPAHSESSITKWVDNPAAEKYNGWDTSESTRPSIYSYRPATREFKGWGPPKSISREEYNGWGVPESTRPSNNSTRPVTEEYNGWGVPGSSPNEEYNKWVVPEPSPNNSSPFTQKPDNILPVIETSNELPSMVSTVPSASPVPEEDLGDEDGVNYPWVDYGAPRRNEAQEESTCVVCWEGPAEGACIPCGHMAACMSCLNAIKSKQGSCPVCRGPIDQVVKIFAV